MGDPGASPGSDIAPLVTLALSLSFSGLHCNWFLTASPWVTVKDSVKYQGHARSQQLLKSADFFCTSKKSLHSVFTVALFSLAKTWKQLKCLAADERTEK